MKNLILFFVCLFELAHLSVSQAAVPIIGGETVQADDPVAKYTVGVLIRSAEGKRGFCSGTIIADDQILTAAHCIEDVATAKIVFKRQDILSYDSEEDNVWVRTAQTIKMGLGLPPLEERKRFEYNDLALLTFAGGLPEGYEKVSYFKGTPEDFVKVVGSAKTLIVAGYGRDKAPSYGAPAPSTPTSTPKKPIQNLKKAKVELTQFRERLVTFAVFAPNASACSGDSGGPAFAVMNGVYYVVGALSRSDCFNSSLYTRFIGQIDQ